MVAVPVAWAVLLLFHPTGDGDEFYPIVRDQVTAWLVVHVGTLLFVPLLAGVVYLLRRGVEGVGALLSRIALAVFARVYTAWEVLIGLGTGILVDQANGLPAAERATGARLVEEFTGSSLIRAFELIGGFAWLIAVVAAGVALFRRADPRSSVAVLLLVLLSAVPIVGAYRRSARSVSRSSSSPCSWSYAAGRQLRRPPVPDSLVPHSAPPAAATTDGAVGSRTLIVPWTRRSCWAEIRFTRAKRSARRKPRGVVER